MNIYLIERKKKVIELLSWTLIIINCLVVLFMIIGLSCWLTYVNTLISTPDLRDSGFAFFGLFGILLFTSIVLSTLFTVKLSEFSKNSGDNHDLDIYVRLSIVGTIVFVVQLMNVSLILIYLINNFENKNKVNHTDHTFDVNF